jgi:hypothetical protein
VFFYLKGLSLLKKSDKRDMYVKFDIYDWSLLVGPSKDYKYTCKLLEESAEQGCCESQWELAKQSTLNSHPSLLTKYKGFKWLKKSVLQGFIYEPISIIEKFDYTAYKRLDNCINAILCLLCIKKYRYGLLSLVSLNIVKHITKLIHKTQTDVQWEIDTPGWQKFENKINKMAFGHF